MATITWPSIPSPWWVELDLPTEWMPYSMVRGEFLKALDAHNKHLRETETPLDEEQFLKQFFWPPPYSSVFEFAVRRGQEEVWPLYWSPLERMPFTANHLHYDLSRLLDQHRRPGDPEYVLLMRLSPDVAQALGRVKPNVAPARAHPPTPLASRRKTDNARAELFYQAAKPYMPGSLSWFAPTALDRANKMFQGDPLLNSKDPSAYGRAWRIAKQRLQEEQES